MTQVEEAQPEVPTGTFGTFGFHIYGNNHVVEMKGYEFMIHHS